MLWLRSRKVYVVRAARRAPSTAMRSPSLPEGGTAKLCNEMNPGGILEMHFVLEIRFQRLKSAFGRL